ncbi:MAG: DDE-type integrase/transposase/recombinase [Patescibacteria group bacterium]
MLCIHCSSKHIAFNGRLKDGKQRYKCCDCGKQFCETTGTFFFRNRIPLQILVVVIFFHFYVPARIVRIFIYFLFHCSLSEASICAWSRKYLDRIPELQQQGKPATIIIRHTDEKKIKISGKEAWWWNTTDPAGNVLTSSISWSRSLVDTRKHLKKHRDSEGHIDVHVTDGMPSYIRATHLFGRTTQHVVRGLQEKGCMHKKRFLMLSNLAVEHANSKVDAYIKLKARESFSNFEQAERTRKAFMLTQILQKKAFLQKGWKTLSTALDEQHNNRGESVVFSSIRC